MTSLNRIVRQLEQERERIDAAIRALTGLTATNHMTRTSGRRPKRRFSAAARRRMAAAQKARWAKLKAQKKG